LLLLTVVEKLCLSIATQIARQEMLLLLLILAHFLTTYFFSPFPPGSALHSHYYFFFFCFSSSILKFTLLLSLSSYSSALLYSQVGTYVDQYVLAHILQRHLPRIHSCLEANQLQLPLITGISRRFLVAI
jgi:hypothetical protein